MGSHAGEDGEKLGREQPGVHSGRVEMEVGAEKECGKKAAQVG